MAQEILNADHRAYPDDRCCLDSDFGSSNRTKTNACRRTGKGGCFLPIIIHAQGA